MLRLSVLVCLLGGVNGCVATGYFTPLSSGLISVYKDSGGVGVSTKQEKSGVACAYNVLGVFAIGDASIRAAKERGRINVVSYFDRELFNVFMLFGQLCTIVYGS